MGYGPDLLTGDNRYFITSRGDWSELGATNTVTWDGTFEDIKCVAADGTASVRRTAAKITLPGTIATTTTYEFEYWVEHNGTYAGTELSAAVSGMTGVVEDRITDVNPTTDKQKAVFRFTTVTDTTGVLNIRALGTIPDQNDECFVDNCRLRTWTADAGAGMGVAQQRAPRIGFAKGSF